MSFRDTQESGLPYVVFLQYKTTLWKKSYLNFSLKCIHFILYILWFHIHNYTHKTHCIYDKNSRLIALATKMNLPLLPPTHWPSFCSIYFIFVLLGGIFLNLLILERSCILISIIISRNVVMIIHWEESHWIL